MQRRDACGGRLAAWPVSSLHTTQRADRSEANLLHAKQRRDSAGERRVLTATSTGRYSASD
jgi:hypothetical protein